MATLAGWLSWWWLPCELASHFRVQYLWIALVCTLALAAGRHWRDAALAAVPVVLNLSVILPLYWPTPDSADRRSAAPRGIDQRLFGQPPARRRAEIHRRNAARRGVAARK